MARSQNSFVKAQWAKEMRKKETVEKRLERRENNVKGGSLDDMIAYIDADENIASTPPEVKKNFNQISIN